MKYFILLISLFSGNFSFSDVGAVNAAGGSGTTALGNGECPNCNVDDRSKGSPLLGEDSNPDRPGAPSHGAAGAEGRK